MKKLKKLLEKAEQGDARAQYALGMRYERGVGIAKGDKDAAPDDVEAAKWFRFAEAYRYGHGVGMAQKGGGTGLCGGADRAWGDVLSSRYLQEWE
jgi:TPR repeat protein